VPIPDTGIGTAAMEFISITGTLPSARISIGNAAMEFQCRDGVHFQYGHLPSARTSIDIVAMEFISSTGTWQVPVPVLAWLFAAQTSEFYCTLEKLQ
jgi:uncharacterized membrane protein